jgi:hypothetical protein
MKYFKIQTNRVSIKNALHEFQSNIEPGEYFISPRPLPGEIQRIYYALACVKENGKNISLVRKFKNCKELLKKDYDIAKSSLIHYWSAETVDA